MVARIASFAVVLAGAPAMAADLPSVASINLCTDQLVLSLAAPEQIRTVSWLSADPEESMLADEARAFPLNYGSAEEVLRYSPDVVIAGAFTSAFTRRLLRDLGYEVVDVAPANSLDEIARNLRQVAAAIDRAAVGEGLIHDMRGRAARIAARRPREPVTAVVLRPGGFTVGANTLADALLSAAGFRNMAAEHGLDRWGSLSMETLLLSRPELLIVTDYRRAERSLANTVLEHPVVSRLTGTTGTLTLASKYWACGIPASLDSAEILQSNHPRR